MRLLATTALLCLLAAPAAAVTVHNEALNGDLSSLPAAPTLLNFATSSSTILGTTGNFGSIDRDYITFTIAADRIVNEIRLINLDPDNFAFCALNSGSTSWVPSVANSPNFLAGIHITAELMGQNLLPYFVTESVTTNSLPAPFLEPGTYCFMIQQTSPILQSYELEFIVDFVLPAQADTWGAIKALYR